MPQGHYYVHIKMILGQINFIPGYILLKSLDNFKIALPPCIEFDTFIQ